MGKRSAKGEGKSSQDQRRKNSQNRASPPRPVAVMKNFAFDAQVSPGRSSDSPASAVAATPTTAPPAPAKAVEPPATNASAYVPVSPRATAPASAPEPATAMSQEPMTAPVPVTAATEVPTPAPAPQPAAKFVPTDATVTVEAPASIVEPVVVQTPAESQNPSLDLELPPAPAVEMAPEVEQQPAENACANYRPQAQHSLLQSATDKAGGVYAALKVRLIAGCESAKMWIVSVEVPAGMKARFVDARDKTGLFVVRIIDGGIHIQGEFCRLVMRTSDRFDASTGEVKKKAAQLISQMLDSIDPIICRLKAGAADVKGRTGSSLVLVASKVDAQWSTTKAIIIETYSRMAKAVAAYPLTVTLTEGCQQLQGKIGDVTLYAQDGFVLIRSRVGDVCTYIKGKFVEIGGVAQLRIVERYTAVKPMLVSAAESAKYSALNAADYAKGQTLKVVDYSKVVMADKPVASSAASGALLFGASGGAAGLATGGVAGAACGVPLAVFTFGLSIPVGAVLGGGAGVCAGAAAGGATGAVAGGAAAYGYQHRTDVKNGMETVAAKLSALRQSIRPAHLKQD